jgi:hypothetical protein
MPSPGVLPPAYPPPFPSNITSLRFYGTGTATGAYSANEFAFESANPKDPAEPEQAWSNNFSFDGVNDHGFVPAGEAQVYWDRYEGGIAIKGSGTFYVEAW